MRLVSIAVSFLAALMLNPTTLRAAVMAGDAWVEVSAEIAEGDASRLAAAIGERKRASDSAVFVYLNSVGGSVSEAIDAAEVIRKAAANTIVGENETCASACFLLFLAGRGKQVFPGAQVGVHSARPADREEEDAASLAVSALVARLYEELGAPPSVIAKSVTTPPGEIYWLTEDDLRSMNVLFLSASPAPTAPAMPKVGEVQRGRLGAFRYMGGPPGDRRSWQAVSGEAPTTPSIPKEGEVRGGYRYRGGSWQALPNEPDLPPWIPQ
jgi:hypothetical protein